MSVLAWAESVLVARRGRGIVRLIEGLTEGDPVAWSIVGAIVVGGIIWFVIKNKRSHAAGESPVADLNGDLN